MGRTSGLCHYTTRAVAMRGKGLSRGKPVFVLILAPEIQAPCLPLSTPNVTGWQVTRPVSPPILPPTPHSVLGLTILKHQNHSAPWVQATVAAAILQLVRQNASGRRCAPEKREGGAGRGHFQVGRHGWNPSPAAPAAKLAPRSSGAALGSGSPNILRGRRLSRSGPIASAPPLF